MCCYREVINNGVVRFKPSSRRLTEVDYLPTTARPEAFSSSCPTGISQYLQFHILVTFDTNHSTQQTLYTEF